MLFLLGDDDLIGALYKTFLVVVYAWQLLVELWCMCQTRRRVKSVIDIFQVTFSLNPYSRTESSFFLGIRFEKSGRWVAENKVYPAIGYIKASINITAHDHHPVKYRECLSLEDISCQTSSLWPSMMLLIKYEIDVRVLTYCHHIDYSVTMNLHRLVANVQIRQYKRILHLAQACSF